MKIGLIARDEHSRGLAIQSKGFYDNIPVDKVLLIRMPRLDALPARGWYDNVTEVAYDAMGHTLDEWTCREWMRGLDVVFTVETTYDWRFPRWARDDGVKTVIQGNPEFFRHDQDEWSHLDHPDAWWWPTPWRIDRLPRGQVIPVPMADHPASAAIPGRRLRVLHVVGKQAWMDRNGTDVVTNALRAITEPMDLFIYGTGWELPEISVPLGSPVNLIVEREGVADRWQMYDDQHVLVLPRRYGGNCLPALEAASRGLGVLMPDVSPNEMLASRFISGRYDRQINLACGKVFVADIDHVELARQLDTLARNPEIVEAMQKRSWTTVPRWSEYRQIYLDELERVCNGTPH